MNAQRKLDQVKELTQKYVFKCGSYFDFSYKDDYVKSLKHRDAFTRNYSWAIPDEDALQAIKEFVGSDSILEIGAGLGLWAYLLKDGYGVNITPTDPNMNGYKKLKNPFVQRRFAYTNVINKDHIQALKDELLYLESNPSYFAPFHNVLMLCWPAYDTDMAAECLELFTGNKLIYIGESYGGCTATDKFFDLLEGYEDGFDDIDGFKTRKKVTPNWELVKEVNLNQWHGIHDNLFMYQRIGNFLKT